MHARKREPVDLANGVNDKYDVSGTKSFEHDRTVGWDLVFCAAFFSLPGVYCLVFPNHVADSDFQFVEMVGMSPFFAVIMLGVLWVATGAFCILFAASVFVQRKDSICFSPDGLSLNIGILRIKNLPWDTISATNITSVDGRNVYLAIEVHDRENTFSRYGATVQFLTRLNVFLDRAPLYVSAQTVKGADIYEIRERVEAYRRAHGSNSTQI